MTTDSGRNEAEPVQRWELVALRTELGGELLALRERQKRLEAELMTQRQRVDTLQALLESKFAPPVTPSITGLRTLQWLSHDDIRRLLSIHEELCQEVAVLLGMRFVVWLRRALGVECDAVVPERSSDTAWMRAAFNFIRDTRVVPRQLMQRDGELGVPQLLALALTSAGGGGNCVIGVMNEDHEGARNEWHVQLLDGRFGSETSLCCSTIHVSRASWQLTFVLCNKAAQRAAFLNQHVACIAEQLRECAALRHIPREQVPKDVAVLKLPSAVSTLSVCFGYGLTRLQAIDLSDCTNLIAIDNWFAARCPVLSSVKLPSSITSIGSEFCTQSAIVSLDLRCCTALRLIASSFAAECFNLRTLELPASITSVDSRFCTDTPSLSGIDMFHCRDLVAINSLFSSRYAAVRGEATIPGHVSPSPPFFIRFPPQIASIGNSVLKYVEQLQCVDLAACESLTSIGSDFAAECKSLTAVLLPNSLTFIADQFCYGCTSLESLELSHCTALTSVGTDFAPQCRSVTLPLHLRPPPALPAAPPPSVPVQSEKREASVCCCLAM